MKIFLYLFVAMAGALTSVEAGCNTALTKAFGQPWWPAVLFSVITLVLLLGAALAVGGPAPFSAAARVPWWGWFGGLISAIYIISMLVAPAQLGAGVFTGLTVSAAVIMSLVLDNWGLVGFTVHPAGWGRILGGALMVSGLVLVAVF